MTTEQTLDTPYSRSNATVRAEWIDSNGHMNVGFYHVAFDQASDSFFEWIGLTPEIRQKYSSSTFALESHLHFHREVKQGDHLRFEARLLHADEKRLHFYQEMFHADEGFLAATYESLSVHMDMKIRRSAPMPAPLYARTQAVLSAHRVLPRPWQIGHVIGVKPPK